jgi:hypothetical protein
MCASKGSLAVSSQLRAVAAVYCCSNQGSSLSSMGLSPVADIATLATMADRRGAVVAWSGAVCGVCIGGASLIAALEKAPSSNPWFGPIIGLAVVSFLILIVSGVPDLYALVLDGARSLNRVRHRQLSRTAILDRWQYTTDGARAPALVTAMEMNLPGTGYSGSLAARQPWVRFAILIACSPVSDDVDAKALRSRFTTFLGSPPISQLVSAVTIVDGTVKWKRRASVVGGTIDAVLVRNVSGEEMLVASARLLYPDGNRYFGRDARCAVLVLHFEPPSQEIIPGTAVIPYIWWIRFFRAFLTAEILGHFLSGDLGLTISGEPPAQVGCRLEGHNDLTDLVDITGLESLPGATRRREYLGYAIADRIGKTTADIARQMVKHMLDYALQVEWNEPTPDFAPATSDDSVQIQTADD